MTLKQMSCGHLTVTEPDEKGKALCADCGTVFQARLTREYFVQSVKAVLEGRR